MRKNRQMARRAAAMAVTVQALLGKNNQVTDAFSVVAPNRATDSMKSQCGARRARVGGGCSRPTENKVIKRVSNRRRASAATAVENNNDRGGGGGGGGGGGRGGAEEVARRLAESDGGEGAGVFYNRVGAINRDLSILMANVLAEERLKEDSKRKEQKARRLILSNVNLTSPVDHPNETNIIGDVRADNAVGLNDVVGLTAQFAEGVEDDEYGGMAVLDAFAASGVRALRCACNRVF